MTGHCMRALVGVAVASMTVAACGGSDSSSDGGASATAAGATSSASGGAAEAQKLVAQDRQAPKPLVIPPLKRRPPAGVRVDVISCKLPECRLAEPGYTVAAKALGWNVTIQHADLTPEAIAAAWTQAVADKPKAILAVSLGPDQIVKAQMEQAQREGIPVVMAASPLKLGEQGADATIGSVPLWASGAKALSDWAIADSGGKAKIVYLYDSAYPLGVAAFRAAQAEVQRLCPDCRMAGLKIKLTEVGKGIPGQVVSYLQKNPGVGYVLAPIPAVVLGVGPAIKSAGLPVKVATANASPANLQAVKSDSEAAAVTMETLSGAWRMMDVTARLIMEGKAPQALLNPPGELQLFDKSNVATGDLKNVWSLPDVPQTFARAWHVAG